MQESSKKTKHIKILPPEGVTLQFNLATIPSRFLALIFDMFVISLSVFVMILALVALFVGGSLFGGSGGYILSFWLISLFLLRQCYFFFFELVWQGSTPGKRLLGLRVIAKDGRPLGLQALIARNLMRDIEIFIPLALVGQGFNMGHEQLWLSWIGLGWTILAIGFPFFHPQSMRFGDVIGGTFVIEVPKAQLLADKARSTTHARQATINFTPEQLSIYGEYELETLAQVLRKVDDHKADIDDLRVISRTIAEKIRYQGSEPFSSPLLFLQLFYAAQRQALEQKLLWGQRKVNKYQKK
ncbi:MAG: RDD family protein [Myxococcales bacterium]|nr:RDD family protein [Myxococcales bacterium]MCB9642104.1 RDD family protein [Myxococcales bacterium]